MLLDDDRIEIEFNPLDPVGKIAGVGDAIVEYLALVDNQSFRPVRDGSRFR